MRRRSFVGKSIAGLGAMVLAPGMLSFELNDTKKKSFRIRDFKPGRFAAPVKCVTPDDGFYIHTFYDICPLSPSQQFLVATKLPYQGNAPKWGDEAEICVIDLLNETIESVYKTKAWSYQLGANVQWSNFSDEVLYSNDIIDGIPVCIRIDLSSKEVRSYAGSKYDIAPDESFIVSPNLLTMNIHQYGYAVPDRVSGAPGTFTREDLEEEGLWRTDLKTNERTLIARFADFIENVGGPPEDKSYYESSITYLFHSKVNSKSNRVMQVFRGLVDNEGRDASLFTLKSDGSDITQCLTREKWNQAARFGGKGNHPNWHPDGEHIIMNCIPRWLGLDNMHFCQFKYDGSDFKILSEHHLGSGHPSINSDGTFLISDTYPKQKWVASPEGELPIRLIDLTTDHEQKVCSIGTNVGNNWKPYKKGETGSHYKLDPHPAWSRDYKKIIFNGAPEGRRQIYIADLKNLVA